MVGASFFVRYPSAMPLGTTALGEGEGEGEGDLPMPLRHLERYLRSSDFERYAELVQDASFAVREGDREAWLEAALDDAPEDSAVARELADALRRHDEDEYTVFFDLSDEAIRLLEPHLDAQDLLQGVWDSPDAFPAWSVLDYRGTYERDWLVHCTDAPYEIVRKGFLRGVADPRRIGLTIYLPEFERELPGYNFAFRPQDFSSYALDRTGRCKYGKYALLLRAPYVLADHLGDQEPQAIFWGPSASDVIVLDVVERGYYALEIPGEEEDELLEADDLETLIEQIEARVPNVPTVENPLFDLRTRLLAR